MIRKLLFVAALLFSCVVFGQQSPDVVERAKQALTRTKEPAQRLDTLSALVQMLMNTNMEQANVYARQMIREAEMTRDRRLMARALRYNGERYAYVSFNKEFIEKANENLNKALELARNNKVQDEIVSALLSLSYVQAQVPNADRALSYTNEAFSVVSTLNNDSLAAATYLSFGSAYQVKKERLLALRNYFNALQLSEKMKNHLLMRASYSSLSSFYTELKAYDKAIDFAQKAMNQLSFIDRNNSPYQKVMDLYKIGNIYVQKKDFDMSVYYFEQSIKLADSLKYPPVKMAGYNGLLMQYLSSKQPHKALDFLIKARNSKNS